MRLGVCFAMSAAALALATAPAVAGTTNACPAQRTDISAPTTQSTPTGVTGSQMTQSMAGVGSNNAMGMTSGIKQTGAGSVDLQGGYQGSSKSSAASGVNAANNGMQSNTSNASQIGYNGASVGGLGANGGNGDLNMNNGGMGGAMDDTNTGMTKITPGGNNGSKTDKDGNKTTPDGNYNYGGEITNAVTFGWGGHPADGYDSHGNQWKGGQLWNGKDGDGWVKNGVRQDGTVDGNGKRIGDYNPNKNKDPGADTGISDGPGGSSATGAAVNTGNHGGNDGGGAGNTGTNGNDGTNAMGASFNGGGRVGQDSPLGQPKPIEAMNSKVLNNGVTDPCAGSMVH